MSYLIYDHLNDCRTDLEKIYTSMTQETACYFGGNLYNIKSKQKEFVLMLENIDPNIYPIFGKPKGKLCKDRGYTLAWATPQQDVDGDWFIPKPKQEWSAGLIGVEVEGVELPEEVEI